MRNKHYFGPERFAKGNLKKGETFSIASGLGGGFLLEYVEHVGRALIFKQHETGGFPAGLHRFADDTITAKHLYVLSDAGEIPAP